jgi:hypothetical protein
MIRLEITQEDIKLAKENALGQMRASRSIGGIPKFQTNEIENKTIGHLGQIKFHQWLQSINIEHKYHTYNTNGFGDLFDFEINGKLIDVKTGKLTYPISELKAGFRFFIAEQQVSKKVDYYINILLDPNLKFAYITGFIRGEDVKKYPLLQYKNNINPAYNIPISDLTPIEKFKEVVCR